MKLEEGFGVELLRIQPVRLLPDLLQLSNAALRAETRSSTRLRLRLGREAGTHRSVDFGVLPVLLLQLPQPPLLLLPLLLVQALQVLAPLVLLQHLVAFELLVTLSVVVLQVFGGLDTESESPEPESPGAESPGPESPGPESPGAARAVLLTVEISSSRSLASNVF